MASFRWFSNKKTIIRKTKENPKPTKHHSIVLHQLCKLISVGMVRKLASEYKVDKKSRMFSPWSHVVTLLFAQFTHAIGLNGYVRTPCDLSHYHVCKTLQVSSAILRDEKITLKS